MTLSELLGTSFDCDCGRTHTVPVRRFMYEPGAADLAPDVLRRCCEPAPVNRVAVVADRRTWDVYGARTFDAMKKAGLDAMKVLVPDRSDGSPVCDQTTCEALIEQLRGNRPDAVVAVGSGVVNDLCKWSTFQLGLPYIVVGTAASMNGYAAANVAAKIAGVKVLVEARPPAAVLAEPAVIERAPREMTTAGFGDTIAKYQSNADWIMNSFLFGEYYCDFCAGIVAGLEDLYLTRPEDLQEGKSDAVGGLFAALFWSGIAMTVVGTSAPASGGEHLLSHTLDMMADIHGAGHDLHGRQVGLGTVFSAALYERILALDSPTFAELPADVDGAFWTVPSLRKAVGEQYGAKRENLELARRKIGSRDVWDQLRAKLTAQVKPAATFREWLKRAGGAISMSDIACPRERVKAAVTHMHEIRKRFTIVDLAWLVGVLPDAADELIDEWLADEH